MIEVNVYEQRWHEVLPSCHSLIARVMAAVLQHYPGASISVAMANDDFVRDLNKRYRAKDKATNVLSFPYQGDFQEGFLGDIALALGTILSEAEESQTALDHYTALMLVHGGLHLLGYDHNTTQETKEMETLEIEIMTSLGYPPESLINRANTEAT